jgi:ketosteroid isomerase-like protein
VDPLQPGDDERRMLDRLVDAQLRAEHDADVEAILALMSDAIVHDVVGLAENPVRGLAAVRRRYQAFLGATVHVRDEPLGRRYGNGFVVDEHVWSGRLTGNAFGIDGRGRRLDHRVMWLLEVADGRIVREVIWNDVQAIQRQLP